MSIQEMIDVLEAAREGKTVQWRRKDTGDWYEVDPKDLTFAFDLNDYRVKPESPREWWAVVYRDGSAICYITKAEAIAKTHCDTIVRVREILEDGGAQ